jgi:Rieske Fe-S protein
MNTMDRRRFVGVAAGALGASALPGCAALVTTPVTPVNGEVRLAIRNFTQLDQPGGYLKIVPAGDTMPIYVLALEGGSYAVVSPVCTHLQCTVNIDGAQLLCPCHGSTYNREGRVLRGPAERPLRRYPARVTAEGELVIRLDGAA